MEIKFMKSKEMLDNRFNIFFRKDMLRNRITDLKFIKCYYFPSRDA